MQDDNIKILVKLFDTLKESSNRNEVTTQKLVIQQLELVNQIKNLPVDDLRQALKEHAKESSDEINECSGVIEMETANIVKLLRDIINKINRMILVVIVAFSVVTASYVMIRATADDDKKIEQLKEEMQEDRKELIDEIQNQIDRIKDTRIYDYTPEDPK